MALYLVLLPMILAVSLATTEHSASSPGSRMDLHLHSQKNASGHWIIRVDTQRTLATENQRELIIDVHQETKTCGNNEIEQVVSMTTVYPPLHDTSMSGGIEPSTTIRNTTATPSTTTTTTTATPSTTTTTTTATPSTTTTTSPRSCPRPEYQLYPGFNCYKAFPDERKSWSEARELCVTDGGDLMVMESEREREDVFIPLYNSVYWRYAPWVGVYIPEGGNNWTTVKGQPALSTWWLAGYPVEDADRKCAQADHYFGLLGNVKSCATSRPFICEISL